MSLSTSTADKDTILSNQHVPVAIYYAIVIRYERLLYNDRPLTAISKVLRACVNLYEYEGPNYLWRAAWPLFIAALETDDPIHQSWAVDRFTELQSTGENLRRAKVFLEAVFREQRASGQPVDYRAWLKAGLFKGFVI